ncbi:MAG TPA: VWA domain-containing protein [Thermoanaerobaculia bacterium]|nr:VWA domain-containing protein [Thermoanaerobaculia bacterium]
MSWPHFATPWALALLAFVPLLAWHHHRRPALGELAYSRLPRRTGRAWRLHLPFYLRLAALSLLVVALARPQRGYAWEESLTEGIDIQIVLDISGSMGAEDFAPQNRLHVAKQVVKDFIGRRPADRIGIVVFSGAALTRSPLTTDRRMLELLVDSLELHTLPDGTAIGVGLASGAARLRDSAAKSKVIVLVTDGVNNAGEIDPLSAAAVCEGLGIKVYTVGVGKRGRAYIPMPTENPMTGKREIRRVLMSSEVDEELLQAIAERTGGRFYRALDGAALEQVFAEIDELEKTPLRVKRYVRYRESFQPLAWAGLALLLLPLSAAGLGLTAEP